MRHDLNFDLVFPIKDEVSAWLMCLKAEALHEAGIIVAEEMGNSGRHEEPSAPRWLFGYRPSLARIREQPD